MPSMSIDFEVYCSCGAGLCNQSVVEDGNRGTRVTVEPCAQCQAKAREEGYDLATPHLQHV